MSLVREIPSPLFRSLHSVAITFESHHVSVFRSASHSQIRNFQNHPYCCSPPSTSPPSSRTRSPKRTSRNSPGSPGAGSAIARTLSPGLRSLTFTKTSSSTPRNQQRLNPSPASPLQGRLRTTSAINSKNPLLPPARPQRALRRRFLRPHARLSCSRYDVSGHRGEVQEVAYPRARAGARALPSLRLLLGMRLCLRAGIGVSWGCWEAEGGGGGTARKAGECWRVLAWEGWVSFCDRVRRVGGLMDSGLFFWAGE